MSAAYGDLMTRLSEAFKSKKLTYDRNILKYNTSKDKVVMTVSYKRNTSTISLDYIFGYSFDESNKLTLTYEGPNDKAAETMLTQIPEIKGIVDAMNGQLNVKPSSTRFNLNNLRIETKDSNLWFDIVK